MDSQSFDYWMTQSHCLALQQHHTPVYDVPPEVPKVPSLSGSPVSSTYDPFPAALHHAYYSRIVDEPLQFGSYHMPMTPSEFGSDHDSPYCSPRSLQHVKPVYMTGSVFCHTEKTHTTSGRRRAQNRAAQRAFRERKEKHAHDLEIQLSIMAEKYNKLEFSHTELKTAYEKLRKTIKLLTQDNNAESEDNSGKAIKHKGNISDALRKLLEIVYGEIKGVAPVRSASA